jgi:hypothetical protein
MDCSTSRVAKINVNSAAIGKSSETAITTAVVRDEAGTFLMIVMKICV